MDLHKFRNILIVGAGLTLGFISSSLSMGALMSILEPPVTAEPLQGPQIDSFRVPEEYFMSFNELTFDSTNTMAILSLPDHLQDANCSSCILDDRCVIITDIYTNLGDSQGNANLVKWELGYLENGVFIPLTRRRLSANEIAHPMSGYVVCGDVANSVGLAIRFLPSDPSDYTINSTFELLGYIIRD